MAVGGFLGSDPILTPDRLEKMVTDGEVRYFLTTGGPGDSIGNASGYAFDQSGMPGMMGGSQSEITSWVKAHGKLVPAGEWTGENEAGVGDRTGMFAMSEQLYDLKGGQ
jgi:hypothetical protein